MNQIGRFHGRAQYPKAAGLGLENNAKPLRNLGNPCSGAAGLAMHGALNLYGERGGVS